MTDLESRMPVPVPLISAPLTSEQLRLRALLANGEMNGKADEAIRSLLWAMLDVMPGDQDKGDGNTGDGH